MNGGQSAEKLNQHHRQIVWNYWLLIILGAWMVLFPLTFGYGTGTVEPAAGRDVWLPLDIRIIILTWSDIISGVVLIFFGWRALTVNRPISVWIAVFKTGCNGT